MRNAERDEIEMAERREKLLATGFRLFAARSIEAVKLQEIATASGIGIATLYRYFKTKTDMVIEIGVKKWQEYYIEEEASFVRRGGAAMTAAAEMAFFLDCFIDLYRNHQDLLRFNRNFDNYVKHAGCSAEQMRPYNEAVNVFADKFHALYRKAQADGTLRVPVSEKRLFVNTMYTMLSVAAKYAEGLIYPPDETRDMTEELTLLKQMILDYYVIPADRTRPGATQE